MATIFNGTQISFDPHDWDGITELCKRHAEFDVPWSGHNEAGDEVLISVNEDNITVETFQSNGWIRENIYRPEYYITEELFHHGGTVRH